MEKYIQEFRKDLKEFEEKTLQFYNGELDKKDYKGFSGGFGSYAQKDGESSMLRLRMTGGRVTKDKLKFVVDSIGKHQITKVHFTTCQTIQLHNLKPDAIFDIIDGAVDHGIITRGGGGDFPRNVMVSPLSGVEHKEYFDVLPCVDAAANYLMSIMKAVKLPRKLKVCFSNSPENVPHATFRDLGFAARPDGRFDVYSAGGLGNNPKPGVLVAEGVEQEKILYYIKAMVDTFIAYGNYDNRAKARTRYMQDTLGDGYKAAYEEKLEAVLAQGQLDLNPEQLKAVVITKTGEGSIEDRRVLRQKQSGLYTVSYHPLGGTPAPGKLGEIYQVIKDMDQVELRLSPDESVYIINLTAKEAEAVLQTTADGACSLFEESVACIGATICQQGVRDSQTLLKAITEAVRAENFADGVLPKIHISGCPSSCGTHQIGVIGFHGGVKVIDRVPHASFTLHVGGDERYKGETFGEQWGVILEKSIPSFMVELGRAITDEGSTFEQWFPRNEDRMRGIAERFLV